VLSVVSSPLSVVSRPWSVDQKQLVFTAGNGVLTTDHGPSIPRCYSNLLPQS
jgi:hypothetical protein